MLLFWLGERKQVHRSDLRDGPVQPRLAPISPGRPWPESLESIFQPFQAQLQLAFFWITYLHGSFTSINYPKKWG